MYDDEDRELYEFTWPGKNAAKLEAGRSTRKTLRPCIEDSRNFDTTENLYIEGDNLEALKILQRSYLRKVKMIYIDPPYNTGNDFIYHDDFREEQSQHEEHYGLYDEDGNRNFSKQNYVVNTKSNPRFHSEWCNMIYPRLKLARNLLSLDGVIFISIDDNEQPALRMICNEIFGANNFIAQLVWKGRSGGENSKNFAVVHEYILCYAKNITFFKAGAEIKEGDTYPKYDKEKRRHYKTQLLRKWGASSRREDRPNLFYPIKAPDGSDVYPMLSENQEGHWRWSSDKMKRAMDEGLVEFKKEGCWRWGADTMKKAIDEGRVEFRQQNNGSWIAYEKIYEPHEGEKRTKRFTTWIDDISNGTGTLKQLFSSIVFDYPKSPELITLLLKMANTSKTSTILDFFSGSSTTAHAVMNLNAHDGGTRKFIMIQLPEPCKPDSEAFKAGYHNICEIGRERIRRAGDKLTEGDDLQLSRENLPDIGFRTFRVDSANMRENVYLTVDEMLSEGMSFESLTDNIKPDRNDMDLLFECVRDLKLPLSLKYSCEEFQGVTIHHYNKPELAACFGKNLTPEVMRYIAESGAKYVYFRDWCFEDIKAKVNLTQIFELYGEESKMRIL